MSLTRRQLQRLIQIQPLYEVLCEQATCNGMQEELYRSRAEAQQAKDEHIELHLQGQFDDDAPRNGWVCL